jgi:hypothetical protein
MVMVSERVAFTAEFKTVAIMVDVSLPVLSILDPSRPNMSSVTLQVQSVCITATCCIELHACM